MNAPAPTWHRYLPSVDVHFPGVGDDERRQRAGLMTIRDLAASRARATGDDAAQLLAAIEAIAGQLAFAGLPAATLQAKRLALVRAFRGAMGLEADNAD